MGALDGKVAIVTGAGRGVGRGEAMMLAAEGAKVVVNDLGGEWDGSGQDNRPAQQVVEEIKAGGGEAVANYDNVADWDGAKRMVDQAIETYGDLNILVNNAGILRDKMTFNMSEQEWDSVITVHLKGHFAPTRHASVYWREQSKAGREVSGRVISTSSESGLFANAGQANYAAAKSGIASLTIVWARELARYGVTANAIAPRARTRLTEGTFGQIQAKEGAFDEWDPDNIAPTVAWLASDDAADVTGQVFIVFGGTVQLLESWNVVNSVTQDHRWSVDELAKAKAELFEGRGSGVPDFAAGNLF